MKAKGILLNGKQSEIIELETDRGLSEVLDVLEISKLQGYHTFGKGYTALWQLERRDKTSMEITTYAGASYPIFIDSKVIIINEDENGNRIDIDMNELQKHFNTKGSFWALIRNFI